MSAALKLATVASSFGLLGASTLYTLRSGNKEFSSHSLALEHTAESSERSTLAAMKSKVPNNYVSFSLGKSAFKSAA